MLALRYGFTIGKIRDIKKYFNQATSIDDFVNDGETSTLEDFIPNSSVIDPLIKVGDEDSHQFILSILSEILTDREEDLLLRRYGLLDGEHCTLQQLSEIFGVTRERVRQIEARCLGKLRTSSYRDQLKDLL